MGSSRSRSRPLVPLLLGGGVALVLGVAGVLFAVSGVSSAFSSEPTVDDGVIATSATLDDEHLPAISRLDPSLREALRGAAQAAALDGLAFDITSGWRSARYQEWLFADAVRTYGSEDVARGFVASPDRSRHVTGEAVDIGDLDAQFWLIQHGSQWGLCQIYANERWHFELATEPGGVCPGLLPDAAG